MWSPSRRLLRAVIVVMASALPAACGGGAAGAPSEPAGASGPTAGLFTPDGPVRVVLITIDTLRHTALEAGMPLLAARAGRARRFTRFYSSSPSTQPSHASKFTGLHPWQHGVTRNGQVLDERYDTVAEILGREGFATAAVVASFPLDPRFGLAQGFDSVGDEFTESRRAKVRVWKGEQPDWDAFYALSDTVTDQALPLIESLADASRQFVWLHYYDPHSPYGDAAPGVDPLETKVLTAMAQIDQQAELEKAIQLARHRYLADCRVLDRSLDQVLTRLLDEDDGVETHVLVTADHGESFGDDGSFGHGDRVTPDQVLVPLLLFSPRVEAEEREDTAGSVDVFATLLGMAGVPAPPDTQGRSLLGPAPEDGGAAFGMRRSLAGPASDVRKDGTILKLEGQRYFLVRDGVHWYGDRTAVQAHAGLPDERDAGRVAALFGAFQDQFDGHDVEEDLSPETQQALEALGYTR